MAERLIESDGCVEFLSSSQSDLDSDGETRNKRRKRGVSGKTEKM